LDRQQRAYVDFNAFNLDIIHRTRRRAIQIVSPGDVRVLAEGIIRLLLMPPQELSNLLQHINAS
jgi:hypothetical protein